MTARRPLLIKDGGNGSSANKVSLGFVEGLNHKIRVIQRRAYGLRDEEYLRLKILTCMLPKLEKPSKSPTRLREDPEVDWIVSEVR